MIYNKAREAFSTALRLASHVAEKTIGLELVPVMPMEAPATIQRTKPNKRRRFIPYGKN